MCINWYDTVPIFPQLMVDWINSGRISREITQLLGNTTHIAWGQNNHIRTWIGFTNRGKKQESIAKVSTTRYRGGTLVRFTD